MRFAGLSSFTFRPRLSVRVTGFVDVAVVSPAQSFDAGAADDALAPVAEETSVVPQAVVARARASPVAADAVSRRTRIMRVPLGHCCSS